MRRFLLIVLLILVTSVQASRIYPGWVTINQPDGSTLTIKGYGDMDAGYFITKDKVILIQEGTVFYIADILADGSLSNSGIIAHEHGNRNEKELKTIAKQNKQKFYAAYGNTRKDIQKHREPMKINATYFPHTGNPKALVILVEFQDSVFRIANTKEQFNKYLNGSYFKSVETDGPVARNYAGVAQYFNDMSFGKFKPQFDVYGPVKLSKPLKYYGEGRSDRMDLLIPEACKLVDNEVDFSQYDENKDGKVDLVYIIYAGYSASWSGNSTDCIWPKSHIYNCGPFDGMMVYRYGVNNELNATPKENSGTLYMNGIGLFCHEFSHTMGLPDLYCSDVTDTDPDGVNNQAMEYWSLMDAGEYTSNGYYPTPYTAWERERMGWLTIDTLKSPASITLKSLNDGGTAYRILNDNDPSGNEYFLIENIEKKGWAQKMKGHGMTITHVNYKEGAFDLGQYPNISPKNPRMTIVAADGLLLSSFHLNSEYKGKLIDNKTFYDEMAGDAFPGTSMVTAFTDYTEVKPKLYNGSMLNKPITDIKEAKNGTITFNFMGGNSTAITEIKNTIQTNKIYTLDGRYCGKDINTLPKGIYILNRHKIIR